MFWRFFTQLLLTFMLVILLFNQSLDRYIEQKYHISFLQDSPFFIAMSKPSEMLNKIFEDFLQNLNSPEIDELQKIESLPQEKPKIQLVDNRLLIHDVSNFLLIGDSMMQGVGITLIPELKKHNMHTLNLAKQSTGLTYSQFFNWPETLLNTLEQNPDIDIIVIMLGANDPWNMKKMKFGGKLWEETYLSRIKTILQIAKAYDIPIFWYEVPLVRNKKLSDKIEYLNTLYAKACQEANTSPEPLESNLQIPVQKTNQLKKFHAFFIQTNPTFSPNQAYTPSIMINDKQTTIRANDGIHFTTKGSYLLTQLLLDHLDFDLAQEDASLENPTPDNTEAR